jgi:hypothetical protein
VGYRPTTETLRRERNNPQGDQAGTQAGPMLGCWKGSGKRSSHAGEASMAAGRFDQTTYTSWCYATPLGLMRRQGPAPKLDDGSQQGATGMEQFVVTRTSEGLWLVAHDVETFASYTTEEEALWVTFARAAERKRAGIDVIVVVTQAQ